MRIDDEARLAEARRFAVRDTDERSARRKVDNLAVHVTEGWKGLDIALLALRGVCAALETATQLEHVDHLANTVPVVCDAHVRPYRVVLEAMLRVVDSIDAGRGDGTIGVTCAARWDARKAAAGAVSRVRVGAKRAAVGERQRAARPVCLLMRQ